MRMWKTNDGGALRRLPHTQPNGSLETTAFPSGLENLAVCHSQPATQSSDVGIMDNHLLATRGTRSCTDGTVRAPGLSAY